MSVIVDVLHALIFYYRMTDKYTAQNFERRRKFIK